jgi:hypothetical protein
MWCGWNWLRCSGLRRLNFRELEPDGGLLFACKCPRMNIAHSCENCYVGRVTQYFPALYKGLETKDKGYN